MAAALEGIDFEGMGGTRLTMRRQDHQLQQPVFITRWEKAGPAPLDYSQENTGHNFRIVKTYDAFVASTPTSCQMQRPSA